MVQNPLQTWKTLQESCCEAVSKLPHPTAPKPPVSCARALRPVATAAKVATIAMARRDEVELDVDGTGVGVAWW